MLHVLSLSFSSSTAVTAGEVALTPVGFTLKSYEYIMQNSAFWHAMWISIERVVLGVAISMILTTLAAYPLSKGMAGFKHQPFFAWFLVITMLFSGGLIPTYMIIKYTFMLNTEIFYFRHYGGFR
jgi:putative aldouronate transport system permease protein